MKPTDYRLFGRTGIKVSPLTLGCMMFGGRTELDDSCRIIDRAIDAGINILDTANVYSRGRSEEFTGEALKRNGKRDRIFLATKVHGSMDDTDPNCQGNSRRHIIQQCEASLRRLQTDYIDLYQIHRPRPEIAIDETLRALDDLIRSGKIRYAGTTTFAAWQVVEALWASKELGLNRFVSEQPPYNLLDRRIERELIPAARTFGLALIPWSPIGGGLLSGKYQRGQPVPVDSRYANPNPIQAKRFTERVYDVIEPLSALAAAKGVTLAQLALAWTIHQPGITSPIIGPRTLEQLEDNLGALDVTFTEADLSKIDEIVPPGTHVAPFYEANFGPHPHRW
ncbi:aldo/keto reductase [Opitutaceae bacterium TAV3]|nr:aldo/keto reductase [Opitutaceae bacterium TAV3]